MNYVILTSGVDDMVDVVKKHKVKVTSFFYGDDVGRLVESMESLRGDIGGHQVLMCVDSGGKYQGWSYDGCEGVNSMEYLNIIQESIDGDLRLVTVNELDCGFEFPWNIEEPVVVDESNPPTGYKIITDDDMKTKVKPSEYICWIAGAWESFNTTFSGGSVWDYDITYAVDSDFELKLIESEEVPPKGWKIVTSDEIKNSKRPYVSNLKLWYDNKCWKGTDVHSNVWTDAVTWAVPVGFELEPKEQTFTIGDKFETDYSGTRYVIISCGSNLVALIDPIDGGRWNVEPVKVNGCHNITMNEINVLFEGEFEEFTQVFE